MGNGGNKCPQVNLVLVHTHRTALRFGGGPVPCHGGISMAKVVLKNVNKVFENNVVAVNNVNIEVPDKEFLVLVGPSGCGKSTTLRMVAGLEELSGGEIRIDDVLVNDVPPKDRDIAMVFQNYALYPHMTVFENMAFGLKLRKYPKEEIKQRVYEAANILGIQELLARRPKELSGGQRQRVAVGRAIVRKPKVFLFDEPLSNLDAKLRVQMSRRDSGRIGRNVDGRWGLGATPQLIHLSPTASCKHNAADHRGQSPERMPRKTVHHAGVQQVALLNSLHQTPGRKAAGKNRKRTLSLHRGYGRVTG